MVRKPISRHRPKASSFNQKASDDPDAILKNPGVCRIVDVTLYGSRIQANLSPLLYPLGLGIADNQLIDRLPALGAELLDVLLKRRYSGPLAHSKPREDPKGPRVLQMKGQLLIAQIPILLQYDTPKHLLGCHALSARVRTLGTNHVLVNRLVDRWIVIQNSRDRLQLPGHFVTRHRREYTQLRNPFFTHSHPHTIEIYPTISTAYCGDDIPNSIRIQQKNDQILN
jgi:hypothetical protein